MNNGNGHAFSTGEAVRFGWETTKANLKLLVAIGLVAGAVAIISDAASRAGPEASLAALLLQVAQVALAMVWIRAALMLHDGKKLEFGKPAEWLSGFFGFLLTQVLYGLIVAGGLILLIVPGVIWAVQFAFAGFLVIDRKLDPIEALKESSRLTHGRRKELFVFGLALIGINLLGAIAFGIGLLVTVPTTYLAAAKVLRVLEQREMLQIRPPAQIMRAQPT